MKILENKKLLKTTTLFLLGIYSFSTLVSSNAGIIPLTATLILILLLFIAFIFDIRSEVELSESNIKYIIVTIYFLAIICIYKSGVLLSSPISGASGFTLGEPYDKSLASTNLTQYEKDKNHHSFVDSTNPKLLVDVYVDHNNLIYKIEHKFDFSEYESEQRHHLTDILQTTIAEKYNAPNHTLWFKDDIFDGDNSVSIKSGIFKHNPSVIYTNRALQESRDTFPKDTDISQLTKKLTYIMNTKK